MQPDIKDQAQSENTTPVKKLDPRKKKAYLAYLESVKEHSEVYRSLASN